jgi:hypothetical protein
MPCPSPAPRNRRQIYDDMCDGFHRDGVTTAAPVTRTETDYESVITWIENELGVGRGTPDHVTVSRKDMVRAVMSYRDGGGVLTIGHIDTSDKDETTIVGWFRFLKGTMCDVVAEHPEEYNELIARGLVSWKLVHSTSDVDG